MVERAERDTKETSNYRKVVIYKWPTGRLFPSVRVSEIFEKADASMRETTLR